VTGTSLTGGTVAFGPNAATSVTCGATSCTATSPAGTGTVDVKVTTTGGTSATSSADQFTYITPPPSGPIKSGFPGKCVDDLGARTVSWNPIVLYSCNGTGQQKWTVQTSGTLTNAVNGKCITVYKGGHANGTPILLYSCNGSQAQVWKATGGHLVNPASGKCMTAPIDWNDAPLILWTCGRSVNQNWTLP
jgi:hypothetical protein